MRKEMLWYGGHISAPNFVGFAKKGVHSDNHFAGSIPCMPAYTHI